MWNVLPTGRWSSQWVYHEVYAGFLQLQVWHTMKFALIKSKQQMSMFLQMDRAGLLSRKAVKADVLSLSDVTQESLKAEHEPLECVVSKSCSSPSQCQSQEWNV